MTRGDTHEHENKKVFSYQKLKYIEAVEKYGEDFFIGGA